MSDPIADSTQEIQTEPSTDAGDIFELGDVRDTKGGPGFHGDGHGGFVFP